jgi:hypothetical protein
MPATKYFWDKIKWSTTYFMIGYAIISGIVVILSAVPGEIIRILSFVISAALFTELAVRCLKKIYHGNGNLFHQTLLLGLFWGFLSFSTDVLLMVVLLPLINSGEVSWYILSQQSYLYWLQFPVLITSTLTGGYILSKIRSIQKSTQTVEI